MKIVIHPDFMQTADFIKQLPQHFAQEGELLYEGRNEVRRYRVKNEWLVVKKYKQPNIIQRIVYTFFKKSKTERAYLFAGMLRKRGFDTPHEVAYIEKKRGGLWTAILSLPNATSLPCPKCCGNAGSTNMPQTSWPRSWCNCTKKEYYMAT